MNVEVDVTEVALTQPFRVSHSTIGTAGIVALRVADGAHTGRGEVSAGPGLAHEDVGEVATEARRLADRLGTNIPSSPEVLAAELSHARATGCPSVALMLVEMAFLDLMARRAGLPLSKLLALSVPEEIRLWRTISMGDPVPADCDRLKVKLGGPRDAAVLAELGALGPDAEVIVDVNRGWTRESLAALREPLRTAGVAAVEDPVADLALLTEFRTALPDTPVLLDEGVTGLDAVVRAAGAADGANVKVTRFGGLLPARRALEYLRANGKRSMLGCFIEPPTAIAYAALLAGLADWTDLDGHLVLASSVPTATLRLDTSGPGVPRVVA